MKKIIVLFLVLGLAGVLFGCGQTQTGSTSSSGGGSGGGSTTTTATITGQVAAASTDLSALGIKTSSIVPLSFRTLADTAVSGAAVSIIQVKADGTQVATGKSATTNSSGNYTISDVTPLASGYYKLVAEKTNAAGTDKLKVESLAVVSSATTESANIAPETTVAVKILEKTKSTYGTNFTASNDAVVEFKNLNESIKQSIRRWLC